MCFHFIILYRIDILLSSNILFQQYIISKISPELLQQYPLRRHACTVLTFPLCCGLSCFLLPVGILISLVGLRRSGKPYSVQAVSKTRESRVSSRRRVFPARPCFLLVPTRRVGTRKTRKIYFSLYEPACSLIQQRSL